MRLEFLKALVLCCGTLVGLAAGCNDPFSSCVEQRNCAPTATGGSSGTAGAGPGSGAAGPGGASAGGAGGDAAGGSGPGGEAGAAGASGTDTGCGAPDDPKNCGACGHDCTALTHVKPDATDVECRDGACYVPQTACLDGFAHCSSQPNDGCEASLADSQNCGSCNVQCSGTKSLCAAGATGPICAENCAPPAPDLCFASCVDLASDPHNCGTCGHDCTGLPNVDSKASGIECVSGTCSVPASACLAGFGHCSTRADDGCETDLKTQANCGACNNTCVAPLALCSSDGSSASCSSSCEAPQPDVCGSKCVDFQSDPLNCGSCGHDCTHLQNVKAGATGIECRSGACYVPPTACNSGTAHCSSLPDDGCEANLSAPAHCGSCALACTGSTPLCSLQPQAHCLPSCGQASPDVCGTQCVNLSNDFRNCGSCGHDCSRLSNVKPGSVAPAVQCVAGSCVLQPSACVSGKGHCSADPDSGCETDLTTAQNCGSCNGVCTPPLGLCSTTGSVMCASSCIAPNPDLCGSKCVNRSSDPLNCGSCGHDCSALANLKVDAAVTCNSSGGCVVPSGVSACVSGFANCSAAGSDSDGCETSLTAPAHCGSCGHDCTALANLKAGAAVSCNSTGGCVVPSGITACATGFANCSTSATDSDGCETSVTTTANCGSCGRNCAALPNLKAGAAVSCSSSGSCVVPSGTTACATGFANCSAAGNDIDGCETPITTAANCGACGRSCASGQICSSGTCCASGQTSCSGTCANLQTDVANCGACGTRCATGQACSAGHCVCTGAGNACTLSPPVTCKQGVLACPSSTGTPVCTATDSPPGTSCGSNLFCNSGSCSACTPNASCQPEGGANLCKNGTISCTTGLPVCNVTTNKSSTTACGPAQSCSNGVVTLAQLCDGSGGCPTAATRTCASGSCNAAGSDCLVCAAGQAVCSGVCCATGQVCSAARCVAPATLAVNVTSVAFGFQQVSGTSSGRTVTLSNTGGVASGTLSITSSNPSEFTIASTTCGTTLGAGAVCGVVVTFRPSGMGDRSGQLQISANPGGSLSVSLSGAGQALDGITGCTTGADCVSGACQIYYRDLDGDTYGNPNNSITVCGFSAPLGYVYPNPDCDDTNPRLFAGASICSPTNSNVRIYCDADAVLTENCTGGGCATGLYGTSLVGVCVGSVGIAGVVGCGSELCGTSIGCGWDKSNGNPGGTPPTCGITAHSNAHCDGPNDCPSGQLCCSGYDCAFTETRACFAGSCPASVFCNSWGRLCNPLQDDCPAGSACTSVGFSFSGPLWGCAPLQ